MIVRVDSGADDEVSAEDEASDGVGVVDGGDGSGVWIEVVVGAGVGVRVVGGGVGAGVRSGVGALVVADVVVNEHIGVGLTEQVQRFGFVEQTCDENKRR